MSNYCNLRMLSEVVVCCAVALCGPI